MSITANEQQQTLDKWLNNSDNITIDYLQLIQESFHLSFHHQSDEFRNCQQILLQQYQVNVQEKRRLRPKPTKPSDDKDDRSSSLSMNSIIAGSAVNIREHRPLSKEIDSSSQILATRLTCLQCIDCGIKDIFPLFQSTMFPSLTHLNLSFNSLREFSVDPLAFSHLSILDLSHNKISSLEGLSSIPKLKILRLHYNQIEILSCLQHCQSIEELWISNNRIDWIQFAYLTKLGNLRILVKQNNPADQKPKVYEFILTLLPQLIFLDSEKVNRNRKESSIGVMDSQTSTSPIDSSNTNGNSNSNSNVGKIAVDVKVMLTQAKAFLKNEEIKGTPSFFFDVFLTSLYLHILEREGREKDKDKDRNPITSDKSEIPSKSVRRKTLTKKETEVEEVVIGDEK